MTPRLMVSVIVAGVLVGTLAARAQNPDEEDWSCARDGENRAHVCFCAGMQDNSKCPEPKKPDDPATEEDESQPARREDPSCLKHCRPDHCHCEVFCKST